MGALHGAGAIGVVGSREQARAAVAERLRARRVEIERAVLTRVYAVSEPGESSDPEYAHGLRAAVSAAIDHGLAALERSGDSSPPIPAVLLAQARLAARAGVSLDVVLRRYLAGYTLLGDFVIQEAEEGSPLRGSSLQRLLRAQAALFDRLLVAVSEEYSREREGRPGSAEERRAERVQRLLDGELVDVAELNYDLDGWHIAAISSGPGAAEALGDFAKTADRRLLLIRRGEAAVWAWLGSRHKSDPEEIHHFVLELSPTAFTLALGEPSEGLAGWRLTHRQARAAQSIALRGDERVVHYANVALVASMLRDDLLVTSLREIYLAPLAQERDGGAVARETLRAYFAAERNASSAAAALGVSRQAVGNRLRAIEEHLASPLSECAAEMEAALKLDIHPDFHAQPLHASATTHALSPRPFA